MRALSVFGIGSGGLLMGCVLRLRDGEEESSRFEQVGEGDVDDLRVLDAVSDILDAGIVVQDQLVDLCGEGAVRLEGRCHILGADADPFDGIALLLGSGEEFPVQDEVGFRVEFRLAVDGAAGGIEVGDGRVEGLHEILVQMKRFHGFLSGWQ